MRREAAGGLTLAVALAVALGSVLTPTDPGTAGRSGGAPRAPAPAAGADAPAAGPGASAGGASGAVSAPAGADAPTARPARQGGGAPAPVWRPGPARPAQAAPTAPGRAARLDALRASPLALADAAEPDLEAIAAARAPQVLAEQLTLLLDPTRPWAVRSAAAAALGGVATGQAEALLLEAACRCDDAARALAATALAGRGPEARATLRRLLWDAAPAVRAAAAGALADEPEALRERAIVEADPAVHRALEAAATTTTAAAAPPRSPRPGRRSD
ncbi:MAG: hypothetical protein M9894_04710 [Planctomycetes bacterium]|nr:hypothetical protein [Planctomycetota bacterium]